MGLNREFWSGRRVLVTGHTGFKGAWLLVALRELGAEVAGFALDPPTEPSLFSLLRFGDAIRDTRGDVRDPDELAGAVDAFAPEIVIHLAAQSLVRRSFSSPAETWSTNVIGTVNLLHACRTVATVRAIIVASSDKCYENRGWLWGYRESDRLGGSDPYSASKAATELVVASHRGSFATPAGQSLATARMGNVVGGGDFAADRLVPDAMRAFMAQVSLRLRHPAAIRPWQHVLDAVRGYLVLAEAMTTGDDFGEAWNFGPSIAEQAPVSAIAECLADLWAGGARWEADAGPHLPEAAALALDSTKARLRLGWQTTLGLEEALAATCAWYKSFAEGGDVEAVTIAQARAALALP